MPYVEDVFGEDDKSRYKWMHELCRGDLYNVLRDVNIFRVNTLGAISSSQFLMSMWYNKEDKSCIQDHRDICNLFLPFFAEEGKDCLITREEYNKMDFKEKEKSCLWNERVCF